MPTVEEMRASLRDELRAIYEQREKRRRIVKLTREQIRESEKKIAQLEQDIAEYEHEIVANEEDIESLGERIEEYRETGIEIEFEEQDA